MKRRAMSFITVLALCLSLCPTRVLAASYKATGDATITGPHNITTTGYVFETREHSYTATDASALVVTGTGGLDVTTGGTIESKNGAGIEVQAGGSLYVRDSGMTVIGTTYGLDIAPGANEVRLFGGTFETSDAENGRAIRADDYAGLLAEGRAFFDESGKALRPNEVSEKAKVIVKECTDHAYDYTTTPGAPTRPTHDAVCVYCGDSITAQKCTFKFDGTSNRASCTVCGQHTITITVDETTLSDLVYDGNNKPGSIDVVVELEDGTELKENEDYTVGYTSSADAGDNIITVTVRDISGEWTFEKSYNVSKAQPKIEWEDPSKVSVPYNGDGKPVDASRLPVVITAKTPSDEEELRQNYLYYSYSIDDGNTYIDGLPTNAGTYLIKANLRGTQNYHPASTGGPIELEITKIDPVKTPPEAVAGLVYDRAAHELVTPGSVWDGAEIQFAQSDGGPWSKDIPTETNAGSYDIYYIVDGSSNYDSVGPEKIDYVEIRRKPITPDVRLSNTSYVYDGGEKKPTVTVVDTSDNDRVLPTTEYKVRYENNQDVSTEESPAKAVVSPSEQGNYAFEAVACEFTITAAGQAGLTITGQPDVVLYGDKFTLGVSGGSGNGAVKWEITAAKDAAGGTPTTFDSVATIEDGQVKVNGLGSFTVQATKSGEINREDATAEAKFHVDPKPVTATVTAANKVYDGDDKAEVTAKIEERDLVSGDKITISGLTGKFSDANAGTNKAVTVDKGGDFKIDIPKDGTYEKYVVTVPTTPVRADITPKPVERPDVTLNPVNGDKYYVFDGTEKKPAVTVTYKETAEGVTEEDTVKTIEIPSTEYTVTYHNNVNVGKATVTVTDNSGGNYTVGTVETNFDITTGGSAVLMSSPLARDLTYNGADQELVTVGTAMGGHLEYALEKTGDETETIEEPGETGDGLDFQPDIPKRKDAGTYEVYYKVVGDDNHEDSAVYSVSVTIKPKTVTSPVITLDLENFDATYDGSPKTPGVVSVKDGDTEIKTDEYNVTYSNNINAGTATVHINDNNGGNYNISGSKTFEITKATAGFDKAPEGIEGLEYTGKAQTLINAGTPKGGTAIYRLENGAYSNDVPTGIDRGAYKVYAKVRGDANHNDSDEIEPITVTIAPKEVTPKVICSPDTFPYDGTEKTPYVIVTYVEDGVEKVLPATEYTVILPDNRTTKGTHTVTIEPSNNYEFPSIEGGTFSIVEASQAPLTIGTYAASPVYFGDIFMVSAVGGSGGGAIEWGITDEEDKDHQSVPPGTIASITIPPNGEAAEVTVNGVGYFTVTAIRKAPDDESYGASNEAIMTFRVDPKPVTAVVVVTEELVYDKDRDTETKIPLSASVDKTDIRISDLKGTLTDVNAGDQIIKIDPASVQTALIESTDDKPDNYDISYPEKITVTIKPAEVKVTEDNTPKANKNLKYNGEDQPLLIEGGELEGGFWVYSADDFNYNRYVPKAIDAGEYEVWYKLVVDSNYTYDGINPKSVNVTIGKGTQEALSITGGPGSVSYGDQFTLQASGGSGSGAIEWESGNDAVATVSPGGLVTVLNVSGAEVTITATKKEDQNYEEAVAAYSFTVEKRSVTAIVTVADKKYNGDKTASMTGVIWDPPLVNGDKIGTDDWTVEFADENIGDHKVVNITPTDNDKYDITIAPVTASILPADLVLTEENIEVRAKEGLKYHNHAQALVEVFRNGEQIDNGNEITAENVSLLFSLDGSDDYTTDIPKAQAAGKHTIHYKLPNDETRVGSVEVTIAKATPVVVTPPTATSIIPGYTLASSTIKGGKVQYEGSDVGGEFSWVHPSTTPYYIPGDDIPISHEAKFNPAGEDANNFETVNGIFISVGWIVEDTTANTSSGTASGTTSAPATSAPGTESASMQVSARDGSASAALTAEAGSRLVNEAVANKSETVVIKPEITGSVSKTEVSIPVSTVSRIGSETDASLTVSTPVADVIIPNGALDTLSGAGSAISVVTERVENTVVLTLTADNRDVGELSGGLTLTVPVENAGPGTVAVLVHEDGTRETIRWSVAEAGELRIPLNGSATVEIVDNSKAFADVPAESWAADAVAFASAHEILNGTGETTFSPELSMSRAMLATVLYNLEGCPDQGLTSAFSDVDSDAWYAAGISWAAENGITSGYGDGQFGPNDNVTREQLAVMLWRYMGSPAADEQALDFVDTDQASSYAMEALYWVTANDILNGYGDGQLDPCGSATRAQAAQMLKNFIENT